MYISTYPLQKTWWFILKSQDGNSMVRSKDFSPFSSAGNVLNTTNQFTTGRSWRIICVANWGFSLSVTQTIVGHFLNLSYKIMLGRNQPFRKKLILVCGKKMTITPKATIRHVWRKMKEIKKILTSLEIYQDPDICHLLNRLLEFASFIFFSPFSSIIRWI